MQSLALIAYVTCESRNFWWQHENEASGNLQGRKKKLIKVNAGSSN